MPSAEQIIAAYLDGKIELRLLLASIERLAKHSPPEAAQFYTWLQRAYRKGRMPSDAYVAAEAKLRELGVPAKHEFDFDTQTGDVADQTRVRHTAGPTSSRSVRRTGPTAASGWPIQTSGPQTGIAADGKTIVQKPLVPGALIKERFLLEDKIGVGGQGVVFKARDRRMEEAEDRNPYVAIKFLSDEFRRHPDSFKALQREVRKTRQLAHPNIVTVYDFDRDGALIYMTMEFLDGRPLTNVIREGAVNGMDFDTAWPIARGMGTALAYAHQQGIVHSDLKPGNVFITADDRVKVLDFGIARAAKVQATATDATRWDAGSLGALTETYASPEMLAGLDDPDPRDDVFALACVTYELLSGKHPFDRTAAHVAQQENAKPAKIKGLSRKRMKALLRGLAFDRDARTPSAEEFLEELEAAKKRRALSRPLAALSALSVIAVGATAAGFWWQRCSAIDDEFILSVRAASAAQPSDADPQFRDLLIEQGDEYLAMAIAEFNPALLSEGVSHAYGAYINALRLDPDSDPAARGLLDVLALYESQAQSLLNAGDPVKSLAIANYGLGLHSDHCGLNRIKSRAAKELE